MRPSPVKKLAGTTIVVVVLGMLTSFWFALLVLGLFLFFWGHKPAAVYGAIGRLPWGKVWCRALMALDDLVEGVATVQGDPQVIATLQGYYQRGDQLRASWNPSFGMSSAVRIGYEGHIKKITDWENDVSAYLGSHLASEKFGFDTCHNGKGISPERLDLKLQKLRAVTQRCERGV